MNNKGQALVFLVALIPLLLVIFAFVFDTSVMIRENNRLDSIAKSSIKYLVSGEGIEEVSDIINKNDKDIKILNINDREISLEKEIQAVFGKIIGFEYYKVNSDFYLETINGEVIIKEKGK